MLTLAYGGLLILCLLLGTKVVDLGPFAFDGSQIPYALILCIVAIIAEIDGRKAALRLIGMGLAFQVFAFAMMSLTLSLPFSEKMSPDRVAAFDLLIGQNLRMVIAGMISYLVATFIIARLQAALSKRHFLSVAKRSGIANVTGQAFDTIIYLSIAFYGIFPLVPLMLGQFTIKACIAFLFVPLVVRFGAVWYSGTGEIDPSHRVQPR